MFRWIAPVFVVALSAALVWSPTDRDAPEITAAEAVSVGLRLEEGTAYHYRLALAGDKRLEGVGEAPLGGRLDLDLDLQLRAYPSTGERQLVGVRIGTLRAHEVVVLDTPALPDATTASRILEHREVIIEIDRRGQIEALRFAPEDPTLFKHLAQMIVGELQVIVEPGARTWIAHERNQHGLATTDYAVVDADAEAVELSRTRTDYAEVAGAPTETLPTVEGRYRVRLARAGHLLRLQGEETIQAGDAMRMSGRIDLEFTHSAPITDGLPRLAAHGAGERRVPGVVPASDASVRDTLEKRVGGLTPDQLVADLTRVAQGGAIADKNRWLWQATGLLRLKPELAERLVEGFADANHAGRALTLDLLASVGHARAQAAMRTALGHDLSDDPRGATLINRLGFIERPTGETLAFAAQRLAESEGAERTAWQYTLGAVAGHHARHGDAARAEAAAAPLLSALSAAQTPEDRRHALRALGNAGLEAHRDALLPHAQDDDRRVRRATARALRHLTDAESEATLANLVIDSDVAVQQAAISTLGKRPLGANHMADFSAQIAKGQIHEDAWPELLDALRDQRGVDAADVQQVLDAMLARPMRRARLRTRIQRLRG